MSISGNKSDFNAQDIVLLIESAAKSGAESLRLGDLTISFAKSSSAETTTPIHPHQNQTTPLAADSLSQASVSQAKEQEVGTEIDTEIDKEDEDAIRELQLAEMMISDPLHYEELLMREEISHETEANV